MNRIDTLWFRIRKAFYPQVSVVRKAGRGLTWVVATRKNAFTRKWVVREELKGKKTNQAVRYAIAKYPGHFLYIQKKAIKNFKNSIYNDRNQHSRRHSG